MAAHNIVMYNVCPMMSSKKKQEFHAFETIQACGTDHKAQASHPFAERDPSGVGGAPPKAYRPIRKISYKQFLGVKIIK